MNQNERVNSEQYIMAEMAPKTDYYSKHPSKLIYRGTERRLRKKLAHFHRENEIGPLDINEKEVNASVKSLIADSMQNYYGEKIGELIVLARNELKHDWHNCSMAARLKQQLNDLLHAYNTYAAQKITIAEVVPTELRTILDELGESIM